MRRAWLLTFFLLVVASPMGARAQSSSLSGQWLASPLTSSWNLGDWGTACGPRPGASQEPGGSVTIAQAGKELRISGAGRTFTTAECWEQFPGLARVAHSAGSTSWRTTCKTAPGDSRQATIVTTVTARGDTLLFDETGQYQFVIQGQNCTASVRRSRSYRRVPAPSPAASQPEGQPDQPASEAPASASKRTEAGPCSAPGKAARLEVRPSRKLVRPGERFAFRSRVLDGRGCPLGAVATFRFAREQVPAQWAEPGVIEVDAAAPEGEIAIVASYGGRHVEVVAEVASRERYEALLQTGDFDDRGESANAAVAVMATSAVGSEVAEARATSRRRTFVMVVGAATLFLGIAGLWVVQRQRRRERQRPSPSRDSAAPPGPAPKRQRLGAICPTCHAEFAPDAQFCAFDGNRLRPVSNPTEPPGGVCPVCGVGFDPGVSSCPKHDEPLIPAPAYTAVRGGPDHALKICPVCGSQYGGDSQFCGADGAALVAVN